jgi:outer membrane protein assembly factor BamD
MRNVTPNSLLLIFMLLLSACGSFRKIEKNPDWRIKYEGAMNYYAKKDYYRAATLFDQVLPIVRGLPEGEKVQFNLAYCQYYQKLYLLASEQFKTFYETYGRSAMVEEARFMYAYSLYTHSPNFDLDQSSSVEAMNSMQQFLNQYPNSKFVEEAAKSIDITQQKLEKKGFENAKQYYKMRQYKAAIVAFDNFKLNFPDSKYVEEAQYLTVVSQYELAEQSVLNKQEERYKEVVEMYKQLVDQYPNSGFLRDAEKIYTDTLQKLTKFKGLNNNS